MTGLSEPRREALATALVGWPTFDPVDSGATISADEATKIADLLSPLIAQWLTCRCTHCHCGRPVTYGYDGNPTHTRGMCEHCDAVRCDAYPGACK